MTSRVRAGENNGMTLKHDFAVIQFAASQAKSMGHSFAMTLSLPSNPKLDAERLAVVIWVTKGGSLQPNEAVVGCFEIGPTTRTSRGERRQHSRGLFFVYSLNKIK